MASAENPEVDPHGSVQLISDKGTEGPGEGEMDFTVIVARERTFRGNRAFTWTFTLLLKINLKCIIHLNVKL